MKFAHLSDIHIGKRVGEFSMIDDQRYISDEIIRILEENDVDAVFIAGDVYDKSMPSAEAVALFDDFMTKLAGLRKHIFIISGNHDSAERISFGSRIMENVNIHIAPVFSGELKCVKMSDEYGDINIYMLPFIKPVGIKQYYKDREINDYTDAVRTVIEHENIDVNARNILIAHQFVTGASRCDSEEIAVGGLDNVNADVFNIFDYVALGHIHGKQQIGRIGLRYSGSPLKYSFSEEKHVKSVTIGEIRGKNIECGVSDEADKAETQASSNMNYADISITEIPLKSLRDMRKIKGTYDAVTLRENYIMSNLDDYVHITLTDEEEIPEAINKLRSIYPNIMKLDYDNTRTRENKNLKITEEIKKKSPLELFSEFYETQNNQPMSAAQEKFMVGLIANIWK